MNQRKHKHIFMALLFLLTLASCKKPPSSEIITSDEPSISQQEITKTTLKTYEGPSLLESSALMEIKVNDVDIFVYEVNVNLKREFAWTNTFTKNAVAYFDFEGQVEVKVTVPFVINSAKVSPLDYEVAKSFSGNTLTFTINQPSAYIVEFNDDNTNVLHLFANPLEKDVPSKDDPNVVYLEPGLYDAGVIPLTSGQTLYLSGGAYVYGSVRTEVMDNITIRGRGIISGEIYTRTNQSDVTVPFEFRSGKNLTMEGIIILDPAGWATAIYNMDGVTIDNLKIISSRPNGDGISLQGSNNVKMTGGFVRTWDDSLVVKNNDGHTTENILFDGVILWTDLAQSMEVGFETNGAFIRNVEFRNITVVQNFHKAVISLHNADIATVSNIRYRNITLENGQMLGDNQGDGINDFLIDFSIEYSRDWSTSPNLGSVSDLYVENVKVYKLAPTIISRIRGDEGSGATINNTTFKNIEIAGQRVKKADDLKLAVGTNVGKITFIDEGEITGALLPHPYDNTNLDLTKIEIINVEAPTQSAVIVPSFAHRTGDLAYLGDPLPINVVNAQVTHGAGTTFTTPLDDGSGPYDTTLNPIANLYDGDEETYFESLEYRDERNEFIGIQLDFDTPVEAGNLRLIAPSDNAYSFRYRIEVRVKAANSSGEFVNYTIASGAQNYNISPARGNALDIAWTAREIKGVQLRIFRDSNPLFNLNKVVFSNLILFGPSLSYGKPIVDATEYADVYDPARLTDGDPNGTSYYESASLPAHIVIDLRDVYMIRAISLHLPSLLSWNTRTQEIALLLSDSNLSYNKETTTFSEVMAKTPLTFDPLTGNLNLINFETPVQGRFVKIIIYSNDIAGGYMAQLSEVYVFGSK